MKRIAVLAVLALLAGSGCFSGGDGAYCVPGSVFVREPITGTCLLLRVECTPAGPVRADTLEPVPTWAACEPDRCDRFDEEDSCRSNPDCHPAYTHSRICAADFTIIDTLYFFSCWAVAPEPVDVGPCDLIDAESCARRDDCAPVYVSTGFGGGLWFEACTSEADPTPAQSAAKHPRVPPPPPELKRDPQTGECRAVDLPFCTEGPDGWPDWGPCNGACDAFATDEPACLLADGCRAIQAGAPGAPAAYAACWQVPPSGPVRGTPCEGLDAYECSRHDDCAAEHELDALLGVTAFVACRGEVVAP